MIYVKYFIVNYIFIIILRMEYNSTQHFMLDDKYCDKCTYTNCIYQIYFLLHFFSLRHLLYISLIEIYGV